MRGFEFGEKLLRVASASSLGLLQSLANSFAGVGAGGDIEQPLIRCGILNDGLGFAFHGEHYRSLALLQLLHEITRTPAKSRERLNVLRDVKHIDSYDYLSTFLGAGGSAALVLPYNKIILLDRVVHTIERHRMFTPGDRVAVAVSGGADSVCLLHVLLELAPRWNLTLSVVHVNHNLRGDASRADAEFVRTLAAELELPFTLRELDLSSTPGNLEQSARDARNAFFREQLAGGLATRIALGHTRSDQAETVLFRFLRGSGATGLAAIRPVTPHGIVRPLIDVERPEIVRFLGDRGIPWREDATNATLDFARNRIRHQLLPQLVREWNPALTETLAHTADLSLAEEAYWQGEIDRLAALHLSQRGRAIFVSAAALVSLPLAAARRLVRHAIHLAAGNRRIADFGHIAGILELAARPEGTGRTQVPGIEVRRSFDWLRFAPHIQDPAIRGLPSGTGRYPYSWYRFGDFTGNA